jgi:hypothetical protein
MVCRVIPAGRVRIEKERWFLKKMGVHRGKPDAARWGWYCPVNGVSARWRTDPSSESFCVTAKAVTYKAGSCPFVQF